MPKRGNQPQAGFLEEEVTGLRLEKGEGAGQGEGSVKRL